MTQFIHSRYPIEPVDAKCVRWHNPVHGWIYVRSNHNVRLDDKSGWYVAIFETPKDLFVGEMVVNIMLEEPIEEEAIYSDGEQTYKVYDDRIEITRVIPRVRK